MLIALAVAPNARAQDAAIDTLVLRAHTAFLSHDLLRGRATGAPGADLAAQYIAAHCRRLGLRPLAGDFLQTVPLLKVRALADSRLVLQRGARRTEFAIPADFTLNVGTRAAFRDFAGSAVFVGRPEDLTGAAGIDGDDLAGRVAVTLGIPGPDALDTLVRRGAVAAIHLVGGDEEYRLYIQSRGEERLYHADETIRSSLLPRLPSLIAGPRLARALLGGLPRAARAPWPLGAMVSVQMSLEERSIGAVNVACLLAGMASPAGDTAIAFTAHYDHLGVGAPDAAGDSVYNGFSDNAAGVAMVLAIAEALRRDPLRRSALFLFFTGEERGLLGSDYYVTRPLWPLQRISAVVNLDAGAPPQPPVTWQLSVAERSPLAAVAAAVAESRGWTVTTSPPRPNSDSYPFARAGVPAIFIIPGPGPYEGLSADSSDALRRRWDRYHQPGDEWSEEFSFAGLQRYALYAYLLARALDGQR